MTSTTLSSRRLCGGLVCLLMVLLAGALPAQEPDPDEAEQKLKRMRRAAIANPSVADPEILLDVYRGDFRHWPRHSDGEDAVRKVIEGGEEMIPHLLPLLDHRDYRMKPAVAFILSRLALSNEDREIAKAKVEPLLFHPKLKSSYRHLLQALHTIDPDHAESLSVELLDSSDKALRQAGFAVLDECETVTHVEALIKLLDTSKGDARHKAFQLLAKTPNSAADGAALSLVGDEYPALAAEVTYYLGSRNNEQVRKGLQALLTFEPDRSFVFALAAVLTLENNYQVALLPDERIPDMERFLKSRDTLLRVIAAAALGNLCQRSDRETDCNRIRKQVVPTLMDVFLKNRYFKDFNCMLDLAAASLRRITGAAFARDLTFWHDWWKEEGRAFVDQQFLIRVDPGQMSRVAICYRTVAEGEEHRVTLAGEELIGAIEAPERETIYFLATDEMASVVDYLYTREFFERRSLNETDLEALDATPLISMEVEGFKRIIKPDAGGDSGFEDMKSYLAERIRGQRWQCLYPGGGFRSWWEDRYDWWKEETDPAVMTRGALEDLLPSLETMSDHSILECVRLIKEFGGLRECLDLDDVRALLSGLSKRYWKIDPVVETVVDLILDARNPEFLEPLIFYLYGTYNRNAFPLLRKAMITLDSTRKSLSDPQWFVRAIAAEACTEEGPRSVKDLIPLTRDEVSEVRFAALRGLAALDTEAGSQVLLEVIRDSDIETRKVVVESLHGLDSPWALAVYGAALEGDDAGLFAMVMKGLGSIRSTRAAEMVERFFGRVGFQHQASEAGVQALARMGGDPARAVLARLYAVCDEPGLEKTILFARADLGETQVFPELLDCLLENTLRERALDAMAYLVVADYGEALWRYRERWENASGESQAYFLKDVLGSATEAAEGGRELQGIALGQLVGALRHEQWPVRAAAQRILEEGTGVSFGDAGKNASPRVVEAVAASWTAWSLQAQ